MASGPVSAVSGEKNPYAGGFFGPTANPTSIPGAFGAPGAQGFPNPGQPGILSARNNSGSNVRIPYARLVPMRGEGAPQSHRPREYGDRRAAGARPLKNEYDGLESGELAWILGRRFLTTDGLPPEPGAGRGLGDDGRERGADGAPRANARAVDLTRASAHGLGMGYGPDRHQRLAYTDWVENFFSNTFGGVVIDLVHTPLVDDVTLFLSSELRKYAPLLYGSSVVRGIDVPQVYDNLFRPLAAGGAGGGGNGGGLAGTTAAFRTQADPLKRQRYNDGELDVGSVGDAATRLQNAPKLDSLGAGDAAGFAAGLFFMDRGPFLRGKMCDAARRTVYDATGRAEGLEYGDDSPADVPTTVDLPANLGDELAFDALYAHMKVLSMFDWSPDGMVLSKLESPSGDPMGSAELDARQAMLFNVAVQGPAITKTWTGDARLVAMPMDKVFILLCADIVWTLDAAGAQNVVAKNDGVAEPGADGGLWPTYAAALAATGDQLDAAETAAETARGAARGALAEDYVPGVDALKKTGAPHKAYFDAYVRREGAFTDPGGLQTGTGEQNRRGQSATFGKPGQSNETRFSDADGAMKATMAWPTGADAAAKKAALDDWDATAETVRRGERPLKTAYMTNFQLRRVTASYLCQHSAHDPSNKASRCGMALGTAGGGAPGADGTTYGGQFIVGGWCIGTVLDNSASRAAVGHQVRSSPSTMAININVDVEWWSGDKLHRHYMDDGVHSRNDAPPRGYDDPPRRAGDAATSDAAKRAVGLGAPPYRRREASAAARDADRVNRL